MNKADWTKSVIAYIFITPPVASSVALFLYRGVIVTRRCPRGFFLFAILRFPASCRGVLRYLFCVNNSILQEDLILQKKKRERESAAAAFFFAHAPEIITAAPRREQRTISEPNSCSVDAAQKLLWRWYEKKREQNNKGDKKERLSPLPLHSRVWVLHLQITRA